MPASARNNLREDEQIWLTSAGAHAISQSEYPLQSVRMHVAHDISTMKCDIEYPIGFNPLSRVQDEALLVSAKKDLIRFKTLVDKSVQTMQSLEQQGEGRPACSFDRGRRCLNRDGKDPARLYDARKCHTPPPLRKFS
jgi:hypothetical protein